MGRVFLIVVVLFVLGFIIVNLIFKIGNPKTILQNLNTSNLNKNTNIENLTTPNTLNKINIFADLKGDLPRAMAIDQKGTLLVSVPAKGEIIALPDEDKNDKLDEVVTVLGGLNQPHGIAFDGDYLYVGETNAVVRYKYNPENFGATGREKLFDLPSSGRHTTRTVKINNGKLYTSVGSSCDVCIEESPLRSSILISNLDGSDMRVFAKGLRNTVFFTFDDDGKMWGADMGRDFLGDDLPKEEVNLIEDGEDYGWPYCYGNKIRDSKFMNGTNPNYCQNTTGPVFEMPAHIAPLGIATDPDGNLLIAQHGSWNSTVPVGYKVVKLSKNGDQITKMEDFLTGFISNGNILGRPADLIFDKQGKLFVSDDKAGVIYKLDY